MYFPVLRRSSLLQELCMRRAEHAPDSYQRQWDARAYSCCTGRTPPAMFWKEYPADMSQQLLLAACEQAERSETAVRAAALMHIARVLARSDHVAAEQLLEQGIALAKEVDS